MAQKKIVQTAGRTQLGEFAPEFARLNDDILFGEVWSRNDMLNLRDRSLVTLTSLISQGITDSSLTYHLQEAKKNGITRTEISEIITHIAFAERIAKCEPTLHDVELIIRRASFKSLKLKISNSPFYLYVGDDV